MGKSHLETLTYPAMLVWGQFAQSVGLIDKMGSVLLHQKTVTHSPQGVLNVGCAVVKVPV